MVDIERFETKLRQLRFMRNIIDLQYKIHAKYGVPITENEKMLDDSTLIYIKKREGFEEKEVRSALGLAMFTGGISFDKDGFYVNPKTMMSPRKHKKNLEKIDEAIREAQKEFRRLKREQKLRFFSTKL
jgi:hypothetical protein